MTTEVTLRALHGRREVFSSTGKWLHPLFELEEFLRTSSLHPESLRVEDKIVGKAAALLLVRLGIRNVRAGVLSKLGRDVLERYNVPYSAEQIVERIDCQTEILLTEVEDPDQAYRIVRARVAR
jgi:zinc transport system ATP-binding protein